MSDEYDRSYSSSFSLACRHAASPLFRFSSRKKGPGLMALFHFLPSFLVLVLLPVHITGCLLICRFLQPLCRNLSEVLNPYEFYNDTPCILPVHLFPTPLPSLGMLRTGLSTAAFISHCHAAPPFLSPRHCHYFISGFIALLRLIISHFELCWDEKKSILFSHTTCAALQTPRALS